jgi:zinc protease
MDVLRELLKDEIREKDNLVYSISSNLVDISKYPEEVFTLSISYESNPKNVELINQKIDKVLEKISKGDLDLQVFKEKKLALVERYKYNLNKNYYWTYAINEYLQNKEPIDNILDIENSINTITVQEVVDLAKKIFNENYLTRSYYSQG